MKLPSPFWDGLLLGFIAGVLATLAVVVLLAAN